jgi:hypothetical protein
VRLVTTTRTCADVQQAWSPGVLDDGQGASHKSGLAAEKKDSVNAESTRPLVLLLQVCAALCASNAIGTGH